MPQVKKINLKIWAVVIVALLFCPVFLYALPEGENVIEGSATFDRSEANTLKINVSSDKAVIDYNNFSIAANESVYFSQLSVSSAALNRVTGSSVSDISGYLSANGIIYLINPNGINIGPNANIDTAAIIASTLNISNADFLAGRNNFFKDGENAFIINDGSIVVRNGGYVALLSQAVENRGVIQASLGTVVVASGEKMTLALDDLNQISVVIDEPVKEIVLGPDGNRITSAVKNSGTITANGGKVILTAKSLNNIFDYAVNNAGVVEAKSIESHNGVIELKGEGAAIINTGTLNAGTVNVEAKDAVFINKGNVIAEEEPAVGASGNITIDVNSLLQGGSIIADKLIFVTADTIDVFIKDNPNAIEVDPLLNTSPAVIIQAPEVKVIARQFGSSDAPVNINASLTYINRTEGDISILDSLGIGTSILLRGPPDGFGAIVYNRSTNLTLEANQVNLIGSNPTYLYGNITFHNFECTTPWKEIYFEPEKTYTFKSSLRIEIPEEIYASVFLRSQKEEEPWFIDIATPTYTLKKVVVQDSININQEKIYASPSSNWGNNVGWNLNTVYWGVASGNWSDTSSWIGGVLPGVNDDVVINQDNITATLDVSTTINSITIGASSSGKSGITLILNGTNSLSVNGAVIVNKPSASSTTNTIAVEAGTLTAASITINGGIGTRVASVTVSTGTINVSGDISFPGAQLYSQFTSTGASTINIGGDLKSGGTFEAGSAGTVNFNGASQTVRNYTYYNLTLSGSGTKSPSGSITLNGDLTVSSGVTFAPAAAQLINGSGIDNELDVSGTIEVNNTDFSGNYTGFETITMRTNSTVDYSKGAAQNIDTSFTYYNLTLSGSGIKTTNAGTLTIDGNWSVGRPAALQTNNTTVNLSGNLTGAQSITQGSSLITVGGDWTNTGTFTASSAGVTLTGSGKQITGSASGITFTTLTINGTYANNNTTGLTVSTALSGTGGLTQGTNAILNISGTSDITTLTASESGNTVNYNGAAAQTAKGTTYGTLKINNAAGVTLDAATSVTIITIGDITASSIFNDGGYQVTSTGTLNLTRGAFKLGAGTATTFPAFSSINISSGTTVEYAAGVAQVVSTAPLSYQNLTFSGAGTKTTVSGTLSIAGNWSVGSPTALNTNNTIVNLTGDLTGTGNITQGTGAISIGGDWTNVGAFTAGTGGVNYNGTVAQSVRGVTYQNLTISGSGTKMLAGDATINGSLTITNGIFVIGAYNLTVTGTTDISGTLRISNTTGEKTFGDIIVNSSGILDFNANETLTVNGNLQIDGSITGNSTWTFQKSGGNGTVSGTATSVSITNATFATSYTNSIVILSIGTLTVNGTTLTNNGTLTVSTELTGTGTIAQGENSTLNINTTAANLTIGALTATASGNTVNYGRSAAQTVKPASYYNLTLSGSGAKTMTSVTSISGDLTISGSATMTANSAFTVSGTLNYSSSGSTTLAASTPISIGKLNQTAGTLNDNGNTITVTGTGASTWAKSGTFTASGTVTFTGVTPQIGASNFNNLTINVGSGNTATLTDNATIAGDLTISSGTLDLATYTANRTSGGGTLTISDGATLKIGGTNTLPSNYTTYSIGATSTVEYGGSGQAVAAAAVSYGHLTFSGSGTKTLGGAITANGNLTISANTSFDLNGNSVEVVSLDNSGTITSSSGNINITSSSGALSVGTVNLSTGGNIIIDAGTANLTAGIVNANNGSVTFTADTMDLTSTVTANGGITLQPSSTAQSIGLNSASGDFNLTLAELTNLDSTGTVTIGRSIDGEGVVTIGDPGALDLSGENYNLEIYGGSITVSRALTVANNITLTTMETDLGGNTDDILVNANITSNSGDISIRAADDIVQATETTIQAQADTRTIALNAAYNDSDGTGSVSQEGTSLITSNSGDITLEAEGDIIINNVNAGSGQLTITSNNGAIEETVMGELGGDEGIDLTAAELVIYASGGIGSNEALETSIDSINGYNYNQGGEEEGYNINIANNKSLIIENFADLTYGGFGIENWSGSVNISSTSGTITVVEGEGIYATQDIGLNAPNISVGDGAWVLADYGSISMDASGDIYVASGALTAGTDITLSGRPIDADNNPSIQTIIDSIDYFGGTCAINISGSTYSGNVDITNSVTLNLSGDVTLNGNLNISGGSTLDVTESDFSITINGNWSNSGIFNARSGTVTFNGTSQSDITGNNTFYNLTIDTASDGAKTVRFGAGQTQTIENNLILTGAEGNILIIRSTSDGSQAILGIASSISSGVNYVDVKDNRIADPNTITPNSGNCVDSGNNANWIFNQNPNLPDSLGPVTLVDGGWTNDNAPTFSFNLSDDDAGQQVKFQIQIDNDSNFSSPVVDYISTLGTQGSFNFTVGQAVGGGAYTTGNAGQTLGDSPDNVSGYYWRIKATDSDGAFSDWQAAGASGVIDFKLDTVTPTITAHIFTPVANADGWYNDNVIASHSATDSLSGMDTITADETITAEGGNIAVSCTATDNAGNSSSETVYIQIDKTRPVITITAPNDGSTYTSSQTLTYTIEDALSGVADSDPASGTVYSTPGTYTVDITATDNAGNTVSETITFTINAEKVTLIETQLTQNLIVTAVLPPLPPTGGPAVSTFNPGPVFLYTPLTAAQTSAFVNIQVPGVGLVPLPAAPPGTVAPSGTPSGTGTTTSESDSNSE